MTNIANESEVKKKNEELKIKRTIQQLELRKLLEQKPVRDFLWRLLEQTKTFHSIWEQSARIHYNAGQQDFGHFLMGEILDANDEAYFQMMRENKDKKEETKNA